MLSPNNKALSREWLEFQFTSNNYRALMNEWYFRRINITRKIQKHTIIKENIDRYFSNTCLKAVRKFRIDHKENTTMIARDDKIRLKWEHLVSLWRYLIKQGDICYLPIYNLRH